MRPRGGGVAVDGAGRSLGVLPAASPCGSRSPAPVTVSGVGARRGAGVGAVAAVGSSPGSAPSGVLPRPRLNAIDDRDQQQQATAISTASRSQLRPGTSVVVVRRDDRERPLPRGGRRGSQGQYSSLGRPGRVRPEARGRRAGAPSAGSGANSGRSGGSSNGGGGGAGSSRARSQETSSFSSSKIGSPAWVGRRARRSARVRRRGRRAVRGRVGVAAGGLAGVAPGRADGRSGPSRRGVRRRGQDARARAGSGDGRRVRRGLPGAMQRVGRCPEPGSPTKSARKLGDAAGAERTPTSRTRWPRGLSSSSQRSSSGRGTPARTCRGRSTPAVVARAPAAPRRARPPAQRPVSVACSSPARSTTSGRGSPGGIPCSAASTQKPMIRTEPALSSRTFSGDSRPCATPARVGDRDRVGDLADQPGAAPR